MNWRPDSVPVEQPNQSQRARLHSRREIFFALIAVCGSFILGLGLAEGTLRLLHKPFHVLMAAPENAVAQFDPELGWSYIPNKSVTQQFGDDKRSIVMHLNEIGARVARPGVHFDPARPTILFIGDSFTFGHGVTYEESLPGQFEQNSNLPYQVVNLGVQGYGTDQAWLMLKRHFGHFDTKVVVCDFMADHLRRNDNADRRILLPMVKFLGTKPRFALQRDGTLKEVSRPVRYHGLSELRLWQLYQVVWFQYGPPPNNELTRALMRELNDYIRSHGATLIVLSWNKRHDGSDPYQKLFSGLDLNWIDTGLNAPADWDSWHVPGDFHPNKQAYERTAQLVADRVRELAKK